MPTPLTAKDWNLLVIAAAKGKALEPVQLQKALFLLAEKLPLPRHSRYAFRAYDYGPFCAAIYSDAEELQNEGLVVVEHGGRYRRYYATAEGLDEAKALRQRLDQRSQSYLDEVIRFVRQLSFKELVEAIYEEFPSMRANSVYRS